MTTQEPKKKRYIIYAPPLEDRANGARYLRALHDALRERGYESFLYYLRGGAEDTIMLT